MGEFGLIGSYGSLLPTGPRGDISCMIGTGGRLAMESRG